MTTKTNIVMFAIAAGLLMGISFTPAYAATMNEEAQVGSLTVASGYNVYNGYNDCNDQVTVVTDTDAATVTVSWNGHADCSLGGQDGEFKKTRGDLTIGGVCSSYHFDDNTSTYSGSKTFNCAIASGDYLKMEMNWYYTVV